MMPARIGQPGTRLLVAAVALAALGTCPVFSADASFEGGVNAYRKRDFNKALSCFQQALRANPGNANAIYYEALCLEQTGKQREALQLYATLVCSYGQTDAGRLAASSLNRLDPKYFQQLTRGRSDSAALGAAAPQSATTMDHGRPDWQEDASDLASLPQECRVPFQREGALIMIDAYVNNRARRMVFDTGAEMVAFGKNHLADLQIAAPTGKPQGTAMGVGSGAGVGIWKMKADIKVGPILRRNFTVYAQETMPTPPLLGQTFFKDFEYTIDNTNGDPSTGTIHFVKRGNATRSGSVGVVANDRYAVPFVRDGNNLVVDVAINGKVMPMYFDTGASGNTFSTDQLKQLNIPIPPDAAEEGHFGIGGHTTGLGFPVASMKLGPIEKRDIWISAVNSAQMKHPLLGQTFFGDWQYTIDNQKNVIKFVRR